MVHGNGARTREWPVWLGLAVYTALRLLLLPSDGAVAGGFNHDGAYITIVADNLLAGRGFVNDASWLVFLQPEQLPMPYHNANPLYPAVAAAVALVTGHGTVWAGYAVSALCSSLLFAALFVLSAEVVQPVGRRTAIAAAGTFFPVVLQDSLSVAPDALSTALLAWYTLWLVRPRGFGAVAIAGICLGLAWLTRSSAIVVLPATVVYLWMRDGLRRAVVAMATLLVVAIAVASPWLIHTAVVWGHPLRSDADYYLLQDYHARAFGGSVDKYWHSSEVPDGLITTVRAQPTEFASFYATGVPIFLRNLVGSWCASSYAISALLVVFFGITAWRF
ncbi:MAG TPA: glycosyltransferase family 39 protein, partial [Gemmataceae bacterium]|nr:glycosyltransferase family 39 protein [Gemmataceae bacterium]